jgi:L-fuconolactonase
MAIIDAQVHAYDRNHPGRPWAGPVVGPPHVTGDEMVAAMDAVGVDGAILVSTFMTYRYDIGYMLEVHRQHPDRFALVKPVDLADPTMPEQIADWARTPGAVGIRIFLGMGAADTADTVLNRTLAEAGRHGLVVNLVPSDRHAQASGLIAGHPDTVVVLDHLGLRAAMEERRSDPWGALPAVLELAQHDNVRIKITGACTLSTQPYPYEDIWGPVMQIVDAYGLDRCMWGTDWTRAVHFLSYQQGVDAFRDNPRFSESDRAALMGGTCAKVYGWSPS